MREAGVTLALRRFVREHERALIVAWIAGSVLLVATLFGWGIGLRGAERAVDAWQDRWTREIDRCAALVEAGRLDEAAERMERLDARIPARVVKHRLDRERERLLTLLASTWTRLDRKGRALDAAARLSAFDPRNWKNHRVQADVARAFGEGDLAREALDRLLAIHPTHLPSLEDRIRLPYDGGRFAEVPPLWRAYLDAWRVATLELACGASRVSLEVPADGKPHRLRVPFALAPGERGELTLATHGWSVDVGEIRGHAPRLAGVAEAREPRAIVEGPWICEGGEALGAGRLAATSVGSILRRAAVADEHGVVELEFEITVYKACSPSLWAMVEQSYENRLLWEELEAVRARTRVGGVLEAGSLFEE